MRSDGLRRVTSDHRSRSDGRALSRALGLDPEVDFDWHEISAVPGDRIVLVTDGVSDVLNDDAIARLTAAGSPTVSARRLVRAALRDHSRDNVTAVVADVVPTGMRVIAPGRRPRQVEPPEEQAAVPGAAQEAITRPLPARHRTSPLGGYRLGSVRSLAAVLWLLLLLLFVAACAVTVAELVWAMTSDLGATAIATIGWTGFAWLWARARQPALVLRAPWWWRRPRRPQDQFREWR